MDEIKQALARIRGSRDRDFISRLRIFSHRQSRHVSSGSALRPARSWPLLANTVDEATAALGVPKEEHRFQPASDSGASRRFGRHRAGVRATAPNLSFQRLQEKLAAMSAPEFGTMTAREFFLYQSQLGCGGRAYTKIARFGLA